MMYAIIGVLTALFSLSLFLNVRLVRKFFIIEDRVNASFETLDRCYRDLNARLKIPVLSDDPTVKQFVTDAKKARDAILAVAQKISEQFVSEEDEVL